jgi:hypothetical protein
MRPGGQLLLLALAVLLPLNMLFAPCSDTKHN